MLFCLTLGKIQDEYSSPSSWIYIFKNSKNSNYDLVGEGIECCLASRWTQVQIPPQQNFF